MQILDIQSTSVLSGLSSHRTSLYVLCTTGLDSRNTNDGLWDTGQESTGSREAAADTILLGLQWALVQNIAQLPKMQDHTCSVDGESVSFLMTLFLLSLVALSLAFPLPYASFPKRALHKSQIL